MMAPHEFPQVAAAGGEGHFHTAPLPDEHREVSFIWSGDLGGQSRCRQGPRGYPILDRIRAMRPQFLLFLGDLVYADEPCDVPPNEPGSDYRATTLDEFRGKHRYQREARSLQDLLADVPVWAMWDDHEVRNNFSGPTDPQMPAGRQALLDYWPIGTSATDPTRLYRSLRYGADLEVFILDTRQYRSPNPERDGPGKTMLGQAQLSWLIERLTRSTATWKVVATTVPLANSRKSSRAGIPGNDSWARADDGTGFETELAAILQACRARGVQNLIWLAADVHYVQGTAFDPDDDGVVDFHEFIAGPLSAYYGRPVTPPPTFRPTVLFSGTDLSNFGVVTVSSQAFRVDIVDADGIVRYSHRIPARSLQR
ncbi:hypothetical protein YTPLAS18_09580 [Nitrospira sp.]|nr:hypothetical protein YTPLAS18_09580 [Nitrospira sp.]